MRRTSCSVISLVSSNEPSNACGSGIAVGWGSRLMAFH